MNGTRGQRLLREQRQPAQAQPRLTQGFGRAGAGLGRPGSLGDPSRKPRGAWCRGRLQEPEFQLGGTQPRPWRARLLLPLGGVEAGSRQTSLTCRNLDPDRERGLEARTRRLPRPRPSARRAATARGRGAAPRDSGHLGSAPQLPTPRSRPRAPSTRRAAKASSSRRLAAGSRGSASFGHFAPREPPGTFPVCPRLRSLLRFSELRRRGPARTSASNPRLACRRPGASPSPGDPAPRRRNFSLAVCAPRLSSSWAKGRAGFRGPATLSASARLPPSPAWGWVSRDLRCT